MLFGCGGVKVDELTQFIVSSLFRITDIDENPIRRHFKIDQGRFDGRAEFILQFSNGWGKEGEFRQHPLVPLLPMVFPEMFYHKLDEFRTLGIGVTVKPDFLEERFINRLLQSITIDDFGEHLCTNVGRAGKVVTGTDAGPDLLQTRREFVDRESETGLCR